MPVELAKVVAAAVGQVEAVRGHSDKFHSDELRRDQPAAGATIRIWFPALAEEVAR